MQQATNTQTINKVDENNLQDLQDIRSLKICNKQSAEQILALRKQNIRSNLQSKLGNILETNLTTQQQDNAAELISTVKEIKKRVFADNIYKSVKNLFLTHLSNVYLPLLTEFISPHSVKYIDDSGVLQNYVRPLAFISGFSRASIILEGDNKKKELITYHIDYPSIILSNLLRLLNTGQAVAALVLRLQTIYTIAEELAQTEAENYVREQLYLSEAIFCITDLLTEADTIYNQALENQKGQEYDAQSAESIVTIHRCVSTLNKKLLLYITQQRTILTKLLQDANEKEKAILVNALDQSFSMPKINEELFYDTVKTMYQIYLSPNKVISFTDQFQHEISNAKIRKALLMSQDLPTFTAFENGILILNDLLFILTSALYFQDSASEIAKPIMKLEPGQSIFQQQTDTKTTVWLVALTAINIAPKIVKILKASQKMQDLRSSIISEHTNNICALAKSSAEAINLIEDIEFTNSKLIQAYKAHSNSAAKCGEGLNSKLTSNFISSFTELVAAVSEYLDTKDKILKNYKQTTSCVKKTNLVYNINSKIILPDTDTPATAE